MRFQLQPITLLLLVLVTASGVFAAHNDGEILEGLKNTVEEEFNFELDGLDIEAVHARFLALLENSESVKDMALDYATKLGFLGPYLGYRYFDGPAANLGEGIMNHLMGLGAAASLLFTVPITLIPGAASGAIYGAGAGVIHNWEVNAAKKNAQETVWHYVKILYSLIATTQKNFSELDEGTRILELSKLIERLKSEQKHLAQNSLKVQSLIKYGNSEEETLRKTAMQLMLSMSAFNLPSGKKAFSVRELRAFFEKFDDIHVPENISKEETVLLTLRFAHRALINRPEFSDKHISELVRALMN